MFVWRSTLANDMGDQALAERLVAEALALAEAAAEPRWSAAAAGNALANLGRWQRRRGVCPSRRQHEAVLHLYQEHGLERGVTRSLNDLGDIARDQGIYPLAAARYREVLARAGEEGDLRLVAEALEGVAGAAAAMGEHRHAARLYGAPTRCASGWERPSCTRRMLPPSSVALATLRQALGVERVAALQGGGSALSLADAEAEVGSRGERIGRAGGYASRTRRPRRAHGARAGNPSPHRRAVHRSRDRRCPLPQPAHRALAREPHPRQARRRVATPGGGASQSLAGGNHRNANLSGIDGRGANFNDTDNRAASFAGACLQGATFRRADLRGASLEEACLFDADFRNADLRGARLDGALFCRTAMPDGSSNDTDCGRLTRCCQRCVSPGESCEGETVACCAESACINDECVSNQGPDRCPVEVCQVGVRNEQGICVYVNSPNNQIGPACTTSGRFCCNGSCCRQGNICLASGCCTPDQNPCQGRCGAFTGACGQQHQCGDCPPVICQNVTCNPQTHVCDQANQPDLTHCTTATGQGGICCDGMCVAGGQCCALSDCPEQIPCRNHCVGHQCISGIDPDRTPCQGQFGEGICCGGFCFSDPNNQVCCATSECPDRVCHVKLCSDNICQPSIIIPEGQQGPGCMGAGEFCCFGNCCTSGQTCDNFACSGP